MNARLTSCALAVLLAACGGADHGDDAASPPLPDTAVATAPAAPAPAASPADTATVPVYVGGDADLDACGAYSRIRRPAGAPPGQVEVRRGPGSRYAVVDRLGDGAEFFSCDSADQWVGIVYPPPGTEVQCGVSSPIEKRAPYSGPCRSGWVPDAYVELLAG